MLSLGALVYTGARCGGRREGCGVKVDLEPPFLSGLSIRVPQEIGVPQINDGDRIVGAEGQMRRPDGLVG